METVRLIPSIYQLSNTSYLSISNPSNMYTDTDSTSYATVTNSQTGTTSYYLYIRGFNFDEIPSDAIVSSFTVKLKASESGGSTSTSYRPYLCNNATALTNAYSNVLSTSVQTLTFDCSETWETIKGYGSNFGIRLNCRRNSRNTQATFNIYGAEIEVNYTIPVPHNITTSVSGDGTIDPSGTTVAYEGNSFSVNIYPDIDGSDITIMDNGVDRSGDIALKPNENTVTAVPSSYTTTGSINGSYYQSAVGKGSDATDTTGNNYCSSNGSTAYVNYSFGALDIPSDATITKVECSVKGHCESTTQSSEVAQCQLYAGSTAKGSVTDFTTTSDSVINLDCGDWTRSELDSLVLRFTIGYYGGNVSGATLSVTYEIQSSGSNAYVYTIEDVTEDHDIIITIGGSPLPTHEVNLSVTNGTITPNGSKVVVEGSSLSFTTEPNDNKVLKSATVNGVQIQMQETITKSLENCVGLFHVDGSSDDELDTSTLVMTGSYDASEKMFGDASIYLNGSNYITVTLPNDYSPITIECWFNVTKENTSGEYPTLFSTTANANSGGTYMHIDDGAYSTTCVCRSNASGSSSNTGGYGSTTITRNVWHHFAYCRNGSSHYYFIDGVLQYTVTQSNPYSMQTIYFGGLRGASSMVSGCYMTGYIDEIMVSSVCKWTNGFTPPTSAYTVGTSTVYNYTIPDITEDKTVVIIYGDDNSQTIYIKVNNAWKTAREVYKKVGGTWVKQTDLTSIFNIPEIGNASGYTYGGSLD